MNTSLKQIHVPKTLDVEAVEQALAELWKQTGGDKEPEHEEATLRTRAADLMVFVTSETILHETHQTISDLALIHPCRALVMLADEPGESSDIELFVSAFTQSEGRSKKAQVCCEEVTLVARGHFTAELPSAVIPLLVPDLPVFLWWRDLERIDNQNFQPLAQAADRLVIDSVNLSNASSRLIALTHLFERKNNHAIAVSDINWARLTSWRALLANFYDVAEYRHALNNLDLVTIDYVSPEESTDGVASQALLLAGWLASRLHWDVEQIPAKSDQELWFECRHNGNALRLILRRVEMATMKPGRLAKVEMQTSEGDGAAYVVKRTDAGLHLETHAVMGDRVCPGRTLPVRNRSTAHLLAREMEILANDVAYEDAVRRAAGMMNKL